MESNSKPGDTEEQDGTSRRNFLLGVLHASGQLALANTAIYSVSLFSSGGKFGGMTAGAKCDPSQIPVGPYCCDAVGYDSWGAPFCI